MAIFFIITLVFLGFCIFMAIMTSRAQKRIKEELAAKSLEYGAIATASLPHVSGLPLAEQTPCQLFVNDSHLIIETENQVFQVELNKLIAAQPKTDMEIQREVTSSAGKAIAGALVFGTVGAIIGARPKTKTQRIVTTYLIINYTNQASEVAVLAFQGADNKIYKALNESIQRFRAGTVTNL